MRAALDASHLLESIGLGLRSSPGLIDGERRSVRVSQKRVSDMAVLSRLLVPAATTKFSSSSSPTCRDVVSPESGYGAVSMSLRSPPKYYPDLESELSPGHAWAAASRSPVFGSASRLVVESCRSRASKVVSPGTTSATFVAEAPFDQLLPSRPAVDVFSTEAEARLVAIVGSGTISPYNQASWREVMEQMARKLVRGDKGLEMAVFEDRQLFSPGLGGDCCRAAFRKADIVVVVRVVDAAPVRFLVDQTSHIPTLVAFESHPDLAAACRLGGNPVGSNLKPATTTNVASMMTMMVPFTSKRSKAAAAAQKKMRVVTEVWNRASSDNIVFALQLLINSYVTPVRSMHQMQATGLKPLALMIRHCAPQLLACLLDPTARAALLALQECDPADQFASYRCIVEVESPVLAAFSLAALQRHNCLGLSAQLPMHLAVPPMRVFRGQPVTHDLAQNLLVGWVAKLGWSWKIVGSMFAIANLFSCQHQVYYRDPANDCMWYDPVFRGVARDGTPFWRRRHYGVETGDRPGTFMFSVLDNGVMTREFWTIVDLADDMSWGLFYYFGAAERAGQTFTGAVVVTPDGQWPSDRESGRLSLALEKCGIKDWEIVRIDHSYTGEPPQLGLPEHVPPQPCLVEEPYSLPLIDFFPRLPLEQRSSTGEVTALPQPGK